MDALGNCEACNERTIEDVRRLARPRAIASLLEQLDFDPSMHGGDMLVQRPQDAFECVLSCVANWTPTQALAFVVSSWATQQTLREGTD